MTLNNSRNAGGRRGRRPRNRPMSEINVTPFVDVMLVLLIVFMVTAPLLTVGVPVDLPKTDAGNLTDPDEPLVVTVDRQGLLYLQETQIEPTTLVPRLRVITNNKPDNRIYVRGDQAIAYGRVLEVMGLIRSAGFNKVALVTELPGSRPAGQ